MILKKTKQTNLKLTIKIYPLQYNMRYVELYANCHCDHDKIDQHNTLLKKKKKFKSQFKSDPILWHRLNEKFYEITLRYHVGFFFILVLNYLQRL